jgi:hypothetical protein
VAKTAVVGSLSQAMSSRTCKLQDITLAETGVRTTVSKDDRSIRRLTEHFKTCIILSRACRIAVSLDLSEDSDQLRSHLALQALNRGKCARENNRAVELASALMSWQRISSVPNTQKYYTATARCERAISDQVSQRRYADARSRRTIA